MDHSVDFEALGLDALFEVEPSGTGSERGWPARCSDDLRRATRVVAWIGSRDPQFVRRLTSLVRGAIVAPSVGAGCPVWEHLLASVGAAAAAPSVREPVSVPASLVDEARRTLRRQNWDEETGLLLVHPGAGGPAKRFAPAGFAAVLEHLATTLPRLCVIIHHGPADSEAVTALSARLARPAGLLREPPLPLLAGVLSHSTAYLGNDSGISHLAVALGVPSVVLFTADRVIWRPWGAHVEPLVVSMPSPGDADVARVLAALVPLLGRADAGR